MKQRLSATACPSTGGAGFRESITMQSMVTRVNVIPRRRKDLVGIRTSLTKVRNGKRMSELRVTDGSNCELNYEFTNNDSTNNGERSELLEIAYPRQASTTQNSKLNTQNSKRKPKHYPFPPDNLLMKQISNHSEKLMDLYYFLSLISLLTRLTPIYREQIPGTERILGITV